MSKKILIGEMSSARFTVLNDWLKKESVLIDFVTEAEALIEKVSKGSYHLCLLNWLLGGIGPFQLIRQIRAESQNKDIKIMVLTRQVQKINIQNAIKAGASDVIAEPFQNEALLNRILYHLAPQRALDSKDYESLELQENIDLSLVNLCFDICERLSRTERGQEPTALFDSVSKVAQIMGSNRTSLVIADAGEATGEVLASSDDPSFHSFPLSLDKYPEIQHVVFSGKLVLIPDVKAHTLTTEINQRVKTIPIGSLMVVPVRYQNEVIGVLTIRRPQASEMPSFDKLRVLQVIANQMAAQSYVQILLRKIYRDRFKTGTG